ncbi:hypothetical protein ACI65C_000204 [Semiaphis heraclei]
MLPSREMSHTVTVTRTTTSTTSAIILNTGYVKSVPGLLKLAEVILGGIVLGLLIYNRDNLCHCWVYGTHNAQLFFLGTISAFFLTSLLLLISCLLSISTGPIISKTNFEFIYHGAGFVFLLLASVLLLLDANDNNGRNPQNHFIIASILGSICQSIMLFYGTKYIPTFGTSYESFLTTVAGCLMTTTVISVSYLLSKNTEVLVRSSLFETIFGIFASFCYFSSSSLLTIAVYTLLYPIFMTMPFTSLFSAIILAYTLGFILGVVYGIDAYWAFKYYKGFS